MNALAIMAKRFEMQPQELETTLKSTVVPAQCSNEQFATFLMVANEYKLNPLTKEIYAFPSRGGIQPIVSIDGWMRIINRQPEFNGMVFEDHLVDGALVSITCRIYHKGREHPTEVTEYMGECRRNTDVWKQWPARMLRHKAAIQCARYAFGFSGIVDEDEFQRMNDLRPNKEPPVAVAAEVVKPEYAQSDFEKNLQKWRDVIDSGKKSASDIIAMIGQKYTLTTEQKTQIEECEAIEA